MSPTPDIAITVTEDHFKRAVPGDQCHCTIGQAVHDALDKIIPALELDDVDPTTIAVNPAEVNGEPCVGVRFAGTKDSDEIHVRFLLQETSAFKVAYTTDNRATSNMRRAAARHPYTLQATLVRTRKSRAGVTVNSGRRTFTAKGHIKALATYAAQNSDTKEAAGLRVVEKLEAKKADKTLPYTLTPSLRRFVAQAVSDSWEGKGTQQGRQAPVKVYKNRRFYA